MKTSILLFAVLISSAISQSVIAADAPLDCSTGPLEKNFGGIPWLIYSCNDHQTLVVITASGSPAMPFVFSLYKKAGLYQLHGEGTGRKALTDAAYKELRALTEEQINALIQKTQSVHAK